MDLSPTPGELLGSARLARGAATERPSWWFSWRRGLVQGLAIYCALLLVGGSALPAQEVKQRQWAMLVAHWNFDFIQWELAAWRAKFSALFHRPGGELTETAGSQLVRTYLERAHKIRSNERAITQGLSENNHQSTAETLRLQAEIDELRQQQSVDRNTVEYIIEQQIGGELVQAGIQFAGTPLPPVQFAFVEPPRKLVVSPRDRIEQTYGQMLTASMSLESVEQTEQAFRQQQNLSAYITNIGGLGAYPTMVVDDASLPWILSTVAHEWTHNYLTFFPLGFNYGANHEITTINETVAEIVGNEVGEQALRRYYPDLAPPPPPPVDEQVPAPPPPAFDFNAEMRQTRLVVDQLLELGQIVEAEKYMELRRQYFVENGYPLRVLNQAYFAFHGSYGTGAASTSPIGPKLQALRPLLPDIHTFLQTVRSFTRENDIDAALHEWQTQAPPPAR